MSQQFNQDSMGRKTFDCSWRENVLKAKRNENTNTAGSFKKILAGFLSFFFSSFFLKIQKSPVDAKTW